MPCLGIEGNGKCSALPLKGAQRVTPAMAAGVSKTLRSMDDVVRVVEEWEAGRAVA